LEDKIEIKKFCVIFTVLAYSSRFRILDGEHSREQHQFLQLAFDAIRYIICVPVL